MDFIWKVWNVLKIPTFRECSISHAKNTPEVLKIFKKILIQRPLEVSFFARLMPKDRSRFWNLLVYTFTVLHLHHSEQRNWLELFWLVYGGLAEQPVLQHVSGDKLVADAVAEAAVDLRAAAVSVEEAEHFHLPLAVHKELGLLAVDSYQHAVGLVHGAAQQPVGDALGERLKEYLSWRRWVSHTKKQLFESIAVEINRVLALMYKYLTLKWVNKKGSFFSTSEII